MAGEPKKAAPFEWLAGGFRFGKKGGIESIDTCKDVSLLVNGLNDNLKDILSDPQATELNKVSTESKEEVSTEPSPSKFLAARLSRLRFLLYDERRITSSQQESRRSAPTVAGAALQSFTSDSVHDLMPRLIENIILLPFESRKHVTAIFTYLLVCGLEGSDAELYRPIMDSFLAYIHSHFERLMDAIINGQDISQHGASDVGLHFGTIYRSILRHPLLYKETVGTTKRLERYVFPFLDIYAHVPNFDISSDAMESLRIVFTAGGGTVIEETAVQKMAEIAADFLERDYEDIWNKRFNPKLLSDEASYMTRRVALQILSSVLLTRANYNVMVKYVASRSNLILAMQLLRDTSPHITLDAFHVFKVFVANPNKPPEIVKILKDNKVKLCRYLKTLHEDKEESDQQFRDEKALIIATIEQL